MKLKIKRYVTEEVETDIELPVYLYFQDEDEFKEEYIKITEDEMLKIEYNHFDLTITSTHNRHSTIFYDESLILQNTISKECFYEAYEDALKRLN